MLDIPQLFSLVGQTAIVTGGATGIGLAVTRALVASGAKVIVLSAGERETREAALAELNGRAVFHPYDVTDTALAPRTVEELIQAHGPVSIFISNAGNHVKKLIEDMTVEDFESVLDVHLVGAFALTKALIPHMKAQKKGSIVYMASMTSYIGQSAVCAYSTAKAGLLGMVHTLASECGADNVRVNAVAPGWIDTPMFRRATDTDPVRLNKIMGRIPMKRVGTGEDIGLACVYLCSEAARYVTGVCLPVDGGGLIGF